MHTMRPQHQQRGFTLIEVLVAILILSIGVLGAAGMQVAALQSNKEARNQAVGVRYAQEIADRMRANRIYASKPANTYVDVNWASPADAPSGSDCANTTCGTPEAVASWDIHDVIERIKQDDGLPGAKLVICRDDSPYDDKDTPQWACSGSGAVFIKLGWTQSDFNSSAGADSIGKGIVKAAVKPSLIYPVGQ